MSYKINQKASTMAHKERGLSTFEKAERTLLTCILGEDTFYEDGKSVLDRLESYVPELTEDECRQILVRAKVDSKLRHAPILWAVAMCKQGYLKESDVELITDRVDCMTDLMAMYFNKNPLSEDELSKRFKDGNRIKRTNKMLPKQMQKGLQKSLIGFDEYQLAKYQGNKNAVKLADAIKLIRAKPENDAQSDLWKRAINGELATPDTWEVGLTNCHTADEKKAFWTRMLTEKTEQGYSKLGTLALLRNLRNMKDAGVNISLIRKAISEAHMGRILPFQIIGAARYAPELADVLQDKLLESMKNYEMLEGDTLFLVDVSASMGDPLSNKSDLRRADAAAGVTAIIRSVCENACIYKFNMDIAPVSSAYNGFPLIENITRSVRGGTLVMKCTNEAIREYTVSHDGNYPKRVIVITDEQDNHYDGGHWGSPADKSFMILPKSCKGYIINIGSYANGVGYEYNTSYTHIHGWSDSVVKYITEAEKILK